MKIVFLGTPQFALPTLRALCGRYDVIAAVCQPDRERDRRGNVVPCAVKREAESLGIPVYQFEKIRVCGAETLRALAPDLMVTCAYGQILSREILDVPRYGTLNVHGSLLPLYRGSAPIQRAIMNGETRTGITIMRTDEGMDTGDIVAARILAIDGGDYLPEVAEKLASLGATLLTDTIDGYASGKIVPTPQDGGRATYAPPIAKAEAEIDFSRPARAIRNLVRGIGYGVTARKGETLKVFRLDEAEGAGRPGEVLYARGKLIVACGEGALSLTELQPGGKRRMSAADYLNGSRVAEGEILGGVRG